MSQSQSSREPGATYVMSRVAQPDLPMGFVGLLRPETGVVPPHPIQIENREIVVGRQAGLELTLADDWVSRRHARIRRVGDEFLLEDLGSSNGTYVDGVPVMTCVLRPGDWIQIGRSLFRFELRLSTTSPFEMRKTWVE